MYDSMMLSSLYDETVILITFYCKSIFIQKKHNWLILSILFIESCQNSYSSLSVTWKYFKYFRSKCWLNKYFLKQDVLSLFQIFEYSYREKPAEIPFSTVHCQFYLNFQRQGFCETNSISLFVLDSLSNISNKETFFKIF